MTGFISCDLLVTPASLGGAAGAAESLPPQSHQQISYVVAPPMSQCHCLSCGIVPVPSVTPVAPATSARLSSPLLELGITALFPKLSILFHNVISPVKFGLSDASPSEGDCHPTVAAVQTNKSALILINSFVQPWH